MADVEIRLGVPSEKQYIFETAKQRYVAYGGARGGGKSWAVRDKAIRLCARWPGIKVLILRRTMPELINNHIEPLKQILGKAATYNTTEKVFRFPNGSRLQMGYCDCDADADRFQGAEYDVIFFDEACLLPEEWINKIDKAVRGVNSFPKRSYFTLNPGGVSHGYFKRLFVDKVYKANEDPEKYFFVQALVTDNKALMAAQPDYIKGLEALPQHLKEMWLYGSWDIYEGQFFEDYADTPRSDKCAEAGLTKEEATEQWKWTHVIKPFDLNVGQRRGWQIYRSYDFGYGKPFSVGWYAVDYEGTIFRILEFYGCTGEPNEGLKWSPDRQFAEVARIEHEHPWLRDRQILGVADPSIWDTSRGESVAESAARYGITFTPGDNNRIAGWMQFHYRLQFDANGYSRFYVFDTCKEFRRTIPLLQYSKTRPEDLDTNMEDHIADEARYLFMARPIRPVTEKEEPTYVIDPLSPGRPKKR